MKPRLAALLALGLLAACTGTRPVSPADGPQRIGGFAYAPPSGGLWQGRIYPPGTEGQELHTWLLEQPGGATLQVQLATFRPVAPVPDEAALARFAAGAAGARMVSGIERRGTPCARYRHRFDQTFSGGGPPAVVATIDEHGLFCADPAAPGRLMQLRVFERTAPGATTGAAERLAEPVFEGLRAIR